MITSLFVALGLWFGASVTFASEFAPSPVPLFDEDNAPYKYSGILESNVGLGSGSVAIHPQLVLGCAHVNFDFPNSEWLSDIRWHWKWNGVGLPPGSGLLMDGQWNFDSYRKFVKSRYGLLDPRALNTDFVVNYSTTNTAGGEYADWIERGDLYLAKKLPKLITGYPIGLYTNPVGLYANYTDPAAQYRMHETGPFSTQFQFVDSRKYPNLMGARGVIGGQGNSGGPVWGVKDGQWAFAGVFTSIAFDTANNPYIGVYALGKSSWDRISSAIGTVGALPGQLSGNFLLSSVPAQTVDVGTVRRNFTVSGMVGFVDTMTLDLVIHHNRRSDLRVELTSPSGATVMVCNLGNRTGTSAKDLVCTGKKILGFRGFHANGVWILSVKDAYPENRGTLVSASLALTTH